MNEISTTDTLVVNLYGGPGVGKTTLAHALTAALSKEGVLTEHVPEYAKELVWEGRRDMLDGTVERQRAVSGEQWRRVERLLGKVEVVVTDSPADLGCVYADRDDPGYEPFAAELRDRVLGTSRLDVYVSRDIGYDQRGRRHTEAESREVDETVKELFGDRFAIAYRHSESENNFDEVLALVRSSVAALRKEPVGEAAKLRQARRCMSLMRKKLSEPDRNDSCGDVVLDGTGGESEYQSVAFFSASLNAISDALDACEARLIAQQELLPDSDFNVESLTKEDIAEREVGEAGIRYRDVLEDGEIERAAFRAVKWYRSYVDDCCSDARDEYIEQAVLEVVGVDELEERLEKAEARK